MAGGEHVAASWEAVFGGGHSFNISLEDVRVRVRGDMAFVTCVEASRFLGRAGGHPKT